MRSMKVAFVLTAVLLFCGISFAQSDWRWQQRDRDRDDNYSRQDDRKAYDQGFRDGQNDRRHNRGSHPRHNDRSYLNGYRAGYGQQSGVWPGRGDRRNDHDADNRGRGPFGGPNTGGPYGRQNNNQQLAYNNGYQEGLRYGQADRGQHSYRPTYSDNYKHGETGYIASYGDKNVYKQNFQQGFRAGYDRGYYGR